MTPLTEEKKPEHLSRPVFPYVAHSGHQMERGVMRRALIPGSPSTPQDLALKNTWLHQSNCINVALKVQE